MSAARAEIRVVGLVQGVGYRYYCLQRARNLGLTGWVRNESDGSVFLLAEGDKSAVNALVDELKVGPPAASVADVRVRWLTGPPECDDFDVAVTRRGF